MNKRWVKLLIDTSYIAKLLLELENLSLIEMVELQ